MTSKRCTVTVTAVPAGSPGPAGPAGPPGPAGPAGPAGVGGILSPYLTPPLIPAAFNDEFDTGTAVLGDRGWQTINSISGVPMNRKGDVTTAAPVLTGSEYNSTLTNGVLRVQATSGMMILKPITAPLQLAARLGDPRVSADHYVALQITDYNTAINNTSQRVAAGYTWGKYVYAAMYLNQFWYTHRQQVPPATDAMYVFTLEAQEVPPDSFDWRNAVIDPYSGRILWSDPVPLSMLNTPISYGGLEVLTAAAAFSWVEIDYVRQYPYGAWFPT